MESFTLDKSAQEKISIEELASIIFKILKRNLYTKEGNNKGYSPGLLSSIKAFEFLTGHGRKKIDKHEVFDKKFAQAVQLLRDKGLIMQDLQQTQSPDFVELTDKGEETDPEKMFVFVGNSDEFIGKLENELGSLDPVARIYLKESLETFESDFLISSSFCLGAMSERFLLLLAESIKNNLNDHKVTRDYSRCKSIKHYVKFIIDNLGKLRKNHPGYDDLFRDLDTKLNTLAGYYRMTRNEAGHPDFVPNIDLQELNLALKTVPKYLKTIIEVKNLL